MKMIAGTGLEKDLSIREVLLQQAALHSSIQPQDMVKLCYQAAFGAEHLLMDQEAAAGWFKEEYDNVKDKEEELFECLSPEICRINMGAWKRMRLPGEWLFRMFAGSVQAQEHSVEKFYQFLNIAGELTGKGKFTFTDAHWNNYRSEYELKGIGPVHHSEEYRRHEHPAYRVVNSRYLRLLPVLCRLAQMPENTGAYVMALDGRCASGKTTLSKQLEFVTGAGIVHMDDFFLPLELRTPERFAQPGGNVHYERFQKEVMPLLARKEAFSYRRFDCSSMSMGELRQVRSSDWRIVEGAYSCHPILGDYMNVKIFSDVEPDEQMRRIKKREGDAAAKIFAERWIPLEENYFRSCHIEEAADLVI